MRPFIFFSPFLENIAQKREVRHFQTSLTFDLEFYKYNFTTFIFYLQWKFF